MPFTVGPLGGILVKSTGIFRNGYNATCLVICPACKSALSQMNFLGSHMRRDHRSSTPSQMVRCQAPRPSRRCRATDCSWCVWRDISGPRVQIRSVGFSVNTPVPGSAASRPYALYTLLLASSDALPHASINIPMFQALVVNCQYRKHFEAL